MSKMPDKLITFVIGSACSGKSTLAGYMGRKGHGITFRSSQCLEEYIAAHHKGKKLSDFISSDFLAHIPHVDDAELLCNGIEAAVAKQQKVIVDGYPRSLHQMFTLLNHMQGISAHGHTMRVVNLVVPLPELLRRMHSRNRPGDTEHRIMAEMEIHEKIAGMFKKMAETPAYNMSFVEFIIPANAENMKVRRDFTETKEESKKKPAKPPKDGEAAPSKKKVGGVQELSFIDSVSRRLNDIFCEIEWKRKDGITKRSYRSINL